MKNTNPNFLTRTANALFATPGATVLTGLGITAVAAAAFGMTDAGADWILSSHPFDVLPRSLAPLAMIILTGVAIGPPVAGALLAVSVRQELDREHRETAEQASKEPADPAP